MFDLTRDDVDLEAGEIHPRSDDWRGLKTNSSKRPVPLGPQLQDLLAPHLVDLDHDSPLLLPSWSVGMLNAHLRPFERWEEKTDDMAKHLNPKVSETPVAPPRFRP